MGAFRQPTRSETAPDPDHVGAYFYDLPAELVAQEPAPRRDRARLLRLDLAGGPLRHGSVRELPGLLALTGMFTLLTLSGGGAVAAWRWMPRWRWPGQLVFAGTLILVALYVREFMQ